jgi:hypothetical protein
LPQATPEPIAPRYDLTRQPWLGDEPRQEAMVAFEMGRLGFSAWQGRGGAASPFESGAGDDFAALAQADHAVRGVVRLGSLAFSAENGGGDRRMPLRQVEEDASTYTRASLAWRGHEGGLAFSVGQLDERLGPLGAFMPSSSDFAMPAQTTFYALGGDWRLSRWARLIGEGGLASTDMDGRFLTMDRAAISSNWRIGILGDCRALCDQLSFTVSQPLRVERGVFSAYLADVPVDYFDPLTFSRRTFSATPSGRQIDFTLGARRRLADGSTLTVTGVASREPRHVANAAPAVALIGAWRRTF